MHTHFQFYIHEIAKGYGEKCGACLMERIGEWNEIVIAEIVIPGQKAQPLESVHNELCRYALFLLIDEMFPKSGPSRPCSHHIIIGFTCAVQT